MSDTTEFEAMERDGWADPTIAKSYADAFDHATRLVARGLADSVSLGAESLVLDLCCGHGVVAAELNSRGANVTGLDFSPAMVSLAEAIVPDAMFIQGDAMAMAFADGSFDAVTIGFGVPHFPDPEVAGPMAAVAGFDSVKYCDVPSELYVRAPDCLFVAFERGAVRAASLLGRQSSDIRGAIRDDLANRVPSEGTKGGEGYLVPAQSVVVSAVRS